VTVARGIYSSEHLAMRVYLMAWEEKEGGWGIRPDGWSMHVSPDEYEDYLKRHWASNDDAFKRHCARTPNPLPWEYSRPVSDVAPREAELPDDHALTRRLSVEKSLRIGQYENDRFELERLTGVKWPGTR
jgi:hypothetical protein